MFDHRSTIYKEKLMKKNGAHYGLKKKEKIYIKNFKFIIQLAIQILFFYSANSHFIRLKDQFSRTTDCHVVGISSFQVNRDSFYVFARVECEAGLKSEMNINRNENSYSFSTHEAITMLNLAKRTIYVNKSWLSDGHYNSGLVILLPQRKQYVLMDLVRYGKHLMDSLKIRDSSSFSGTELLSQEFENSIFDIISADSLPNN